MRLNILLPFCLLGSAIASPAELAPVEPIVELAMAGVGRALGNLDTHFNNTNLWREDARRAADEAHSLTKEIILRLRSGSKDVAKGPSIALTESIKLYDWSNALTNLFTRTSAKWTAHKRAVVATVDPTAPCSVLDTLIVLSRETSRFNDAVNGKMLTVAGQVGKSFKGTQTTGIDNAIKEYEK
jgi:hypothetical protein